MKNLNLKRETNTKHNPNLGDIKTENNLLDVKHLGQLNHGKINNLGEMEFTDTATDETMHRMDDELDVKYFDDPDKTDDTMYRLNETIESESESSIYDHDEIIGAQEHFWTTSFNDFEISPFPLVLNRIGSDTIQEESGTFDIDLTNFENMKAIFGVSKYTLIKAIWTLVLYYYQRTEHIVFGSITNSNKPETPELNINTIPVPVRLSPLTKISELMKNLERFRIESMPHLKTKLSSLREWIGLAQTEVFFETVLNYTRNKINSLSAITKTSIQSQLPFTMNIVEDEGLLTWTAIYNPGSITTHAIQNITNTFQRIMKMILIRSNCTVTEICAIPEAYKDMLYSFGTGPKEDIKYECAHYAFEEIARSDPHLIAVEHEERSITYGELNQRADEIACLLMNRGVKVGDYVGLVTTRSIEMVCGIFGILKAGGAYI
ncbi:hypothetical protein BC833DRAFT_653766, partial [Globomyces pollinis-pini]